VPGTSPPARVARWRTITLRRGAVASRAVSLRAVSIPLDAMPEWWPGFFTDFPARPLRATTLHVITETACHAGHLDAARELTDGTQWLVLE
jgi:hypothetical protein